jgi:formylglycine-generating enzyme required for sulfatase activity
MKTILNKLLGLSVLALLAGVQQATAQGTRFFRIAGPAATTINAFRADGTMVWSNALTGTNYTVQAATSLGGGTNWVDYVQLLIANRVNTNRIIDPNPPAGMALIPAGSFEMGDKLDGNPNELPLHTVYVSAFYMDQYDVTYALWQQSYNWAITNGYSFDNAGAGKAALHPVQQIDWYDCVKWSNARSAQAGLTPVYYTDAGFTQVFTNGSKGTTVYANWSAKGYRLPTEAEWEKAARGGLSAQRFPWGNMISWSQANYYGDPKSVDSYGYDYDLATAIDYDPAFNEGADPYTSPVGSFAPNGYGLYDMAGNVWQWCWDWYGSYDSVSQTDPRGPTTGSVRVLRGGGWLYEAVYCRSAFRFYDNPAGNNESFIGFRSVLYPGQ